MPLSASDFVGLDRAQLQEVSCSFGFADKVERLVFLLHDGPIRVVGAKRGVDHKPSRELHKQFDVLALFALAVPWLWLVFANR